MALSGFLTQVTKYKISVSMRQTGKRHRENREIIRMMPYSGRDIEMRYSHSILAGNNSLDTSIDSRIDQKLRIFGKGR
jgi:hypothetical protein